MTRWRPDARPADQGQVRILGIDPGLRRTGYGCLDHGVGGPTLVEAGVLRLDARTPMEARLGELDAALDGLMTQLRPTHLAVEAVFSHPKHVRTAILMAHARGVVLLAGQRRRLPLRELAPAAVKRAVAGNGRASKSQMQHAVAAQLGLPAPPEPHDVADALAIALCATLRDEVDEAIAASARPALRP